MLPFGAGNHPERGKQKQPPSNRHFSFNGFPGEASDHPAAVNKLQYSDAGQQTSPGRGDRQPVLPRPRAPTSLPTVSDDRHDGEMKSAETDETHGAFSFYDGLPSPRWRLVMVIAMLGLAWAGGDERLFLSRRIRRRGFIADASAPRGGRKWGRKRSSRIMVMPKLRAKRPW